MRPGSRRPSAGAPAPADPTHRRRAGTTCARSERLPRLSPHGRPFSAKRSVPRIRPTSGGGGRRRSRPTPSPRPSQAFRSSSPKTRPRRRSRLRSPCARFWRRRARPRPLSLPIRRSPAAFRRNSRDGASRSRIPPAARSARPTPAPSPSSSSWRRATSGRSTSRLCSPIRRRASAATRAGLERAARGAGARNFPRRAARPPSTNSMRSSPRREPQPRTGAPMPRSGRSARRSASPAKGWRATLSRRSSLCARSALPRLCALGSSRIARRSTRRSRSRTASSAAPHGLDALIALMDEWSEAAGDGFACALAEYAALFDEALAGVRAPPTRGGHPRLADSRSARSAPALLRPRRWSPVSTRRFGRPRSRPTPFSTGRCAPRSACRRRNGGSDRPRMILSPRSARARRSSAAPESAAASRPSPRAFSSASARPRGAEAIMAAEATRERLS